MNYNPFLYNMPLNYIPQATASKGILGGLFRGMNFSSIISNTSKTLNVINQTIPIVKQAGPIVKNAKTMFKVMNEFKKVETPSTTKSKKSTDNKQEVETINSSDLDFTGKPVFFM